MRAPFPIEYLLNELRVLHTATPITKWLYEIMRCLSSPSSDVRYQAFLDADALDDESFLSLAELWMPVQRGVLGLLFEKRAMGRSERPRLRELLPAVRVVCSQDTQTGRLFLSRGLARLMRNRTDVRLLRVAVRMRENIGDQESRDYLLDVYERLLPGIGIDDADLLRVHEPVFAKVLLRPLRQPSLTIAVMTALETAGSRKGLAYVSALANVFEKDLQNWRNNETSIHQSERDAQAEVLKAKMREIEIYLRIPDERARTSGMYVPALRHLDFEPEVSAYIPPPTFTSSEAEQMEQIITAARFCAQRMQERFVREENSMTLLHPSCSPAVPSDQLLRPAGSSGTAPDELLRAIDDSTGP